MQIRVHKCTIWARKNLFKELEWSHPFSPTVPHVPCTSTLLMGLGIQGKEMLYVPVIARWLGNGREDPDGGGVGSGGGGDKVPQFFDAVFHKKFLEQQRGVLSVPNVPIGVACPQEGT